MSIVCMRCFCIDSDGALTWNSLLCCTTIILGVLLRLTHTFKVDDLYQTYFATSVLQKNFSLRINEFLNWAS